MHEWSVETEATTGLQKADCRLFVYLAREAPIGVVLRRGPSAWTRLSVWHTDADTFAHGQWLGGRVYERRSDVSADGSLFVYFARKSTNAYPKDSWVAISRPPYFTALALWFVGGTYCTGGFFPDRRAVWLGFGSDPPDQGHLPSWLVPSTAVPPYIDRTNNWTERTVYINRLLRDGWVRVSQAPAETWERRYAHQPLTLVMTRTGFDFQAYGGPYIVEYAVRPEPGAELIHLGRGTWADWDQRGRLVIAQQGRLFHCQADGSLRQLADFNQQCPERVSTPAQGYAWPNQPP
jgi:hypothetical protein